MVAKARGAVKTGGAGKADAGSVQAVGSVVAPMAVKKAARKVAAETAIGRKRRVRRMARVLAETHPDAHCELNHTGPLELAVATILSAQCTDQRVNEVTPKLFARYPSAADYAAANRPELEEEIKPTGFFRNKTDSLITLGQALVERHDGVVPDSLEELV